MDQKRVLAIHDISGVGKCSLTVALPIISAFGVETSVLPTAILSTHTGGFEGFTYRDLTQDILPIVKHWKTLNLKFDAIYTGFLGSFLQIDLVIETINTLKKDTIVIVDPVMADNGVLYSLFDKDFPIKMRELCKKADILVPNITEACFLLEEPYKEGPYSKDYIENLVLKLSEQLNAEKVVLTGVCFDEDKLGVACYDKNTNIIEYAFREKLEGLFHGTGDVFGSALTGAYLSGASLHNACEYAVGFTVDSIIRTIEAKTEPRYGVNFEAGLKEIYNFKTSWDLKF